MYTHAYAHENTCACTTPSICWSTDTKTHNLCTNMRTHTHTHVYKQIHTHMHIYTYIHVRTHTHLHIYTHTHTKCTYEAHASTPGRTARQRTCKEPLQTKEALHFSFARRNQTTFRTSNARTSVQQSRSKRARRNLSPRMIKLTVHEEMRGQWKKRPNPATAHPQSQQRG